MSSRRYFLMRNQKTGHTLEIGSPPVSSGTPLKLGKGTKPVQDLQLFWQDNVTGTIRSKLNDMCIDVYAEVAVIGTYVNGNPNQQWVIAGSRIQNRVNPAWVLSENKENGTAAHTCKVIAGLYMYGSTSQHWTIDIPNPKFFRIKSKNSGLYLVQHGIGQVELLDKNKCQQLASSGLWYEHYSGPLLSRKNDFFLSSRGDEMFLLSPNHSQLEDHWFRQDDHVIWSTNNDIHLDITVTQNGSKASPRTKGLTDTQKWIFENVDCENSVMD